MTFTLRHLGAEVYCGRHCYRRPSLPGRLISRAVLILAGVR